MTADEKARVQRLVVILEQMRQFVVYCQSPEGARGTDPEETHDYEYAVRTIKFMALRVSLPKGECPVCGFSPSYLPEDHEHVSERPFAIPGGE